MGYWEWIYEFGDQKNDWFVIIYSKWPMIAKLTIFLKSWFFKLNVDHLYAFSITIKICLFLRNYRIMRFLPRSLPEGGHKSFWRKYLAILWPCNTHWHNIISSHLFQQFFYHNKVLIKQSMGIVSCGCDSFIGKLTKSTK